MAGALSGPAGAVYKSIFHNNHLENSKLDWKTGIFFIRKSGNPDEARKQFVAQYNDINCYLFCCNNVFENMKARVVGPVPVYIRWEHNIGLQKMQ